MMWSCKYRLNPEVTKLDLDMRILIVHDKKSERSDARREIYFLPNSKESIWFFELEYPDEILKQYSNLTG